VSARPPPPPPLLLPLSLPESPAPSLAPAPSLLAVQPSGGDCGRFMTVTALADAPPAGGTFPSVLGAVRTRGLYAERRSGGSGAKLPGRWSEGTEGRPVSGSRSGRSKRGEKWFQNPVEAAPSTPNSDPGCANERVA